MMENQNFFCVRNMKRCSLRPRVGAATAVALTGTPKAYPQNDNATRGSVEQHEPGN